MGPLGRRVVTLCDAVLGELPAGETGIAGRSVRGCANRSGWPSRDG